MDRFWSSSPVVERTEETFTEHVSIAGESRRFEFTKPIVWLQQSSSQIRFMHGGKVFDTGSTYNDWGGYLHSINSAMEEAQRVAAHFGVTIDSSLEVQIYTTLVQSPATEDAETIRENAGKPEHHRRTYLTVPNRWRKEVVEKGERLFPTLGERVLAECVTWSSKNTPEQNAALAKELRQKWPRPASTPLPVEA